MAAIIQKLCHEQAIVIPSDLSGPVDPTISSALRVINNISYPINERELAKTKDMVSRNMEEMRLHITLEKWAPLFHIVVRGHYASDSEKNRICRSSGDLLSTIIDSAIVLTNTGNKVDKLLSIIEIYLKKEGLLVEDIEINADIFKETLAKRHINQFLSTLSEKPSELTLSLQIVKWVDANVFSTPEEARKELMKAINVRFPTPALAAPAVL